MREDLAAGEYVVLEVEDTGCGMDQTTRAKMFDPFFSTKSTGRGLGLASTLGIVRRHRGAIVVESKIGSGTRIGAIFPTVAGKATTNPPMEAVNVSGHGLVLVVDDEDPVRAAVQRILQASGYRVVTAVDGRDALDVFERHRPQLRLVVLDRSMPRLSEEETLRALRKLEPKLPVILMSGFTDSIIHDEWVRLIAKPFRAQALQKLAAELLAQSSQ